MSTTIEQKHLRRQFSRTKQRGFFAFTKKGEKRRDHFFVSATGIATLFSRADSVAALLRERRVAFLNGPVSMPFARVPYVRVDLAIVDWDSVARKIAK